MSQDMNLHLILCALSHILITVILNRGRNPDWHGGEQALDLLKKRIREQADIINADVLRVDMFLNHQIDVGLLNEIGKEFYSIFKNEGINKILTVEASGIGIACVAAQYFSVPVVFAKKRS